MPATSTKLAGERFHAGARHDPEPQVLGRTVRREVPEGDAGAAAGQLRSQLEHTARTT